MHDQEHLEDRTVLLVRDAMDRASADLPPLPDLAGPALAEGRRRKSRTRLAVASGVLCLAALGTAGAVSLTGGGHSAPAPPAAATVTPTPTASPLPEPVHIEPTPGEESMADLPDAERTRQENFQQQAVGVLQELLPEGIGTVQRTDIDVRQYQVTKGGKKFVLIFSVRPHDASRSSKPCADVKGVVCKTATLPGGVEAEAITMPMDSGEVTGTWVAFRYGGSDVSLSLDPDAASNTSAPVTNDQLLAVAAAPAFLHLVRIADEQPMEERQSSVPAG
ncbi:hypothetical protein [Streptomyces peucetius]